MSVRISSASAAAAPVSAAGAQTRSRVAIVARAPPMSQRSRSNKDSTGLRWGIGVRNLTDARDPRDVYNNITSPNFEHFVGYQHRVIEINVDTGE